MAKINQIVLKLQEELKEKQGYLEKLRVEEPEAYHKEYTEVNKEIYKLRVKHLETIIEVYKEQNPKKYESKKDALEAKLKFLKNGGNIANWNYTQYVKVSDSKQEDSQKKLELSCEKCDFKTTSESGLKQHISKSHVEKEDEKEDEKEEVIESAIYTKIENSQQ